MVERVRVAFWRPGRVGAMIPSWPPSEAFHWRRYVRQYSDRFEMCSHVGILIGHALMMIGWWSWFFQGHPGVHETAPRLGKAS